MAEKVKNTNKEEKENKGQHECRKQTTSGVYEHQTGQRINWYAVKGQYRSMSVNSLKEYPGSHSHLKLKTITELKQGL